jgi:glutaredoxin-like protein NrdH
MTVVVYTKPYCVQCEATKKELDKKGIHYELIDLTEDEDAYELVQTLGYRQAPVVVADDKHWSGFRPDKIGALGAEAMKG